MLRLLIDRTDPVQPDFTEEETETQRVKFKATQLDLAGHQK